MPKVLHFHLHTEIEEAPQREETGILDWITLVILITFTVIILVSLMILWKRRVRSPLVRMKDPPKIVWGTGFALIHVWSTFIVNAHLWPEGEPVWLGRQCCICWTLWMQYVFGLQPWITMLTVRILNYGWVFHRRFRRFSATQRDIIQWLVVLFSMGPLCVMAIVFTMTVDRSNVLYSSNHHSTCGGLALITKTFLSLWFILWLFILMCTIIRLRRSVENRFLHEYQPLKRLTLVGTGILLLCSALSITSAIWESWGRTLFTLSIMVLHGYTFFCLMGHPLLLAFTGRDEDPQFAITLEQELSPTFSSPYRAYDLAGTVMRQHEEQLRQLVLSRREAPVSEARAREMVGALRRLTQGGTRTDAHNLEQLLRRAPPPKDAVPEGYMRTLFANASPREQFLDYCARTTPYVIPVVGGEEIIVKAKNLVDCYRVIAPMRENLIETKADSDLFPDLVKDYGKFILEFFSGEDHYVPLTTDLFRQVIEAASPPAPDSHEAYRRRQMICFQRLQEYIREELMARFAQGFYLRQESERSQKDIQSLKRLQQSGLVEDAIIQSPSSSPYVFSFYIPKSGNYNQVYYSEGGGDRKGQEEEELHSVAKASHSDNEEDEASLFP